MYYPPKFKNDDERKAFAEEAIEARRSGKTFKEFAAEKGVTYGTLRNCIIKAFPNYNCQTGEFGEEVPRETNSFVMVKDNAPGKKMRIKYCGAEIEFEKENLPEILSAIRISECSAR